MDPNSETDLDPVDNLNADTDSNLQHGFKQCFRMVREESEENEINEFLEEFLGCVMSATDPAEPDRNICRLLFLR